MRILASADHHFATGPRWDECLRVHDWMAELVERERPDLFVSGGDIYDGRSTPVERAAVADCLTRIASVCPVVVAKGNHDFPRDLELLGRLSTRHPIVVEEGAGMHVVAGVAVAAVAWPDTAQLAASARERGLEGDDLARGALRGVLSGFSQQWRDRDGPKILLGHFMIDGSQTSTGQPLLGLPLNLGLADLALAGADAVIAGHIHLAQEWRAGEAPCLYTGSPHRTDFGQLEDKSVVLLEWTGQGFRVERIPTPARRLLRLETEWSSVVGRLELPELEASVMDAELRLQYRCPADQRESARREAEVMRDALISAGAHSVRLDPIVEVETRARAPEVAQATDLRSQIEAYWRCAGFEPESRRESLLAKLADLEVQCAA